MKELKGLIESILIFIGWVTVIAGIGLLLAFPIKWAWNYTIPFLFGLNSITWGQAWCLNFISGCLIKGTSHK